MKPCTGLKYAERVASSVGVTEISLVHRLVLGYAERLRSQSLLKGFWGLTVAEKESRIMSAASARVSTGNTVQPRDLLRARCEVNGSGRDCRILNLTSGRAFIESFVPATAGSRVKLEFRLPNGHQICAAGVVSRHQFRVGFDVDFIDLSAKDTEQIAGFVG